MNNNHRHISYVSLLIRASLVIFLFFLPALACKEDYVEPTVIAPQDLSGKDFSYRDFVNADLSGKNLSKVDFTGASLIEANFQDADCTGAIFDLATLEGADFTGAKLDQKWALLVDFLTTREGNDKDFSGYDMVRVAVRRAKLVSANMQRANLTGAFFRGSDFSNANLADANLQGAYLTSAILSGADFTGANLTGTNLEYATLVGATITQDQLESAKLGCTQMPDGTVFQPNECPLNGTPEYWQP